MKKLSFTLIALMFAVGGYAQATFGLKGGLNISNMKAKENYNGTSVAYEAKSRTGVYGGGLVEFPLSDAFFMQIEALYMQNGFTTKEHTYTPPAGNAITIPKTKARLNSLQFPVFFKYGLGESKAFRLNFGPYAAFKLSEKFVDKDGKDLPTPDGNANFKSFDFGLLAGVEYNLENGLFFDARYNFSLIDQANSVKWNKVTNSFFNIGLGYKFGKK